jgi:RNA-directed DNA polymerase
MASESLQTSVRCSERADLREDFNVLTNTLRKYMDTVTKLPAIYWLGDGNASEAAQHWWHFIDWSKVRHAAKSLQIRLAKAVAAKRWHKVKRLQWLISHSLSAKLLAVRRVSENKGKRSAGIDGQTWRSAECKQKAVGALSLRGYKAKAVRRVYIPKSNGKKRPLGIPTMHDRAMQALYLQSLEPVSETTGDLHSYGFRLHRSCADAIGRSFDMLCQRNASQWILEGDIKGCFDNISHDWLVKHIPLPKKLLKQWLKSGYVEKNRLFPTTKGTPQGSIISPTLANMVLDGLESHIDKACGIKKIGQTQVRKNPHKIHFIRYADDFIVTCTEKEYLLQTVKPAIEAFLEERGLSLSADKTTVTHIEQGFDFLGQNIRKFKRPHRAILLIRPAKKNIKTFLAKVKGVIKQKSDVPTRLLIKTLNPMIRGWAMYHRHIVAKRVYSAVDHHIFHKTWRWAKRRHSGKWKNKRWIKKRYFTCIKARDWLLFDIDPETKEKVTLFQASTLPIKRHKVINSHANPFSLQDEPYFEQRIQYRLLETLSGRQRLMSILEAQKGRCAYCGEFIDVKTGWHIHHIIPRLLGGKDTFDNLVMLHSICHKSVHLNGFTFSPKQQPRPPNVSRQDVSSV